ncbi:class IV lanthionine synthetase LanL [Streptomyces triticiradicis]|uniref:non-specific serine/threonine protein kinase n=1 Tax=Streptomyces triticiradicis TaxID=2651189 RepID=A0A7J5D7Q2_9ACTN|nr:class IV lanthionine synthetase LanL [Streptomyces triticiradicis]KAB1979299.1 protein kinase/lanthionine synthetase C family protein [Streptomyces triticiradicis]
MTSQAIEVDLKSLLHQALQATGTGARWTTDADEMWCRLTCRSGVQRRQGWKLHVSATAASAPEVLVKALDVLLREEAAFKFVQSLEQVSALNSRATPRGSSGKFITVYPPSDGDAARIALALHKATAGLAGPRILSDQPYAPHSLVHYRYGAFVGRRRLSDQGLLVWFIEDPDGNPVEDKRTGQYSPPPWAVSPFPASVPLPPRQEKAARSRVVLGGRFSVREAIRHTNKGGVYRGTDVTTGAPVVIKEARPHVEGDAAGSDIRDWLRAEARTLEKLKGTGLAPEPLAMFETGGHLFLAQEEVPGVPLRTWVAERFRDVGSERYRADALDQVGRLIDLVAEAHAHGCVLRDFTPGNVMVRPDGELRLIDLELAVLKDDIMLPTKVGTPGFSAPERLADAPVSPTADYYSLGATVCFVLSGKVPNLLSEEPATRPAEQRFAEWLAACAGTLRLPDGLPEMILGLMKDDPGERWDLTRARAALRETDLARPRHPAAGPVRTDEPDDVTQMAVTGMVNHLVDSMTPADDRRLWPVSTLAGETDPCTVQQGAAGVLAVLTRYFELTGDPRLPDLLSTAGNWIAARTGTRSIRPGLHFGGRGIAWALYDAGRAIDDRTLTDHALALALAPLEPTPSHDITHGCAGSGLAAAHLWHRSGDPRLAELVVDAADRLAVAAQPEPSGVSWPVPAEAVSEEAGKRYLGFAHGTSGIGSFLLTAAAVSDRPEHLELAVAAGEHLVANAVTVGRAAQWPAQATDLPTAPYWCHGSAGIGSFLVRLWQRTGDERFGDLARGATHAVVERASRAPLAQCHGLAGNGDFLLDMADATGDPAYRAMADDLARLIVSERAHRDSHVVFSNEYGDVSTSWSDGSAGILAFLLRIRHTDSRHWTVQQPG